MSDRDVPAGDGPEGIESERRNLLERGRSAAADNGASRLHPIVGVGASAGGLEALQDFVRALPADSGLAIVVVQHLAPDHESMMENLLAVHTRVPVRTATDGLLAEPNTVTVMPPGSQLRLEGRRIRLEPIDKERAMRAPIDRFFISLAEEVGSDGCCVVLSGTGTDGTTGLRAVKAAGGIAVVQDSGNARFPGMPDSAVATGLVDFVLPANRIPERLIDIVRHRESISGERDGMALREEIEAALPRIRTLLAEDGPDFGPYKPGTLIRRVERRMNLLRHRTVEGLIETLERDPDERARLAQDFLIGVTRFLRDLDAFAILNERVIEPLVAKGPERIRIWVPGCSTGEEAYSIAMLCLEAKQRHGADINIQVFGTDIDQAALNFARLGVYNDPSLENVSPKRRAEHFVEENGAFTAGQALRELCIFAPHNVLVDPPFSKLDLISCRNLLIYLDKEGQRRAITRFHYALREGGHLFLSPSETLGREESFFESIDKANRLFQRDSSVPRAYSTAGERLPRPRASGWVGPSSPAATSPSRPLGQRVEEYFVKRFAAPHAVIDARGDVVFLSERMTRFVRPAGGETSIRLEDFLIPPLRLPVRSALADLRAERSPGPRTVLLGEGDDRRLVAVEADVMDENRFMVVLRELVQPDPEALEAEADSRDNPARARLERELVATRQQLDITLSEYEISSQELRNTNEQLLSLNEEMQSTNEELETSREELQSVNEELETMNAELRENNRQLQRANSDLKNLLESTQIATLFLDTQLCVRGFTPEITDLFGVRQRDEGRPVAEIARRFSYDTLAEDAAEVSRTLQNLEREVRIDASDQTFIMRMKPYRTVDDKLDGFVMTFFDITERTRSERLLERQRQDLARQYGELETLYDTTPVGLSLMDRDLRWIRINEQLAAINGFPVADHIGKRQDELIPDIDGSVAQIQRRVFETGEAMMGIEVRGTTPAEPDRMRDWITDYYPVVSEGRVFAVGCCIREVTEQKELERQLKSSLDRLELAVSRHPIFMAETDGEGRLVWSSGMLDEFPGDDDAGQPILDRLPTSVSEHLRGPIAKVLEVNEPMRLDVPLEGDRTYDVSLEPLGGEESAGLFLLWFDVTDRRRAEDRRVLLLGELQHRVKNTLATVLSIVRFAASTARDVRGMEEALTDRLLAISRTHDLLTASEWTEVSVDAIVRSELEPYVTDPDVVELRGLDVDLPPRSALAIALAVHELAVNAAKHGALAVPQGRILITLERIGDMLRFEWREADGRPVEIEPERSGFGRFLLEEALPYQVDGEAELRFPPEGASFTLTFPRDEADGEPV